MTIRFQDRHAAGRHLANALRAYANQPHTLVLALPRGGVPVGYEVSQALQLPLDICLVRKLGLPNNPELAMGAIALGGVRVFNYELINALDIPDNLIEHEATLELRELNRRDRTYRNNQPLPQLEGHTVILVDDGIATGATMRAAISVVKAQAAKEIIVAVPVAPATVCKDLSEQVSRVVCLHTPRPFESIGRWYNNFLQTTDRQVVELLKEQTTAV